MIKRIIRKKREIIVKEMKVSELNNEQLSSKFKLLNIDNNKIVNVKCNENGDFDLRGKNQEYRIIVEDK